MKNKEITIDEAKSLMKQLPEMGHYRNYIDNTLAGDYSVAIMKAILRLQSNEFDSHFFKQATDAWNGLYSSEKMLRIQIQKVKNAREIIGELCDILEEQEAKK